jgi:hypothetical protein
MLPKTYATSLALVFNRCSQAYAFNWCRRVFSSQPTSYGKYSTTYSSHNILPLERPPDPSSLSSTHSNDDVNACAELLYDWMKHKTSVLCLTGAGMSTESGIPDYRGHKGSYFTGHKPVRLFAFKLHG